MITDAERRDSYQLSQNERSSRKNKVLALSATHRVIMNTGILYARMLITIFLSLYTTRITLQALGAEDFGTFNVVAGAITMLTFLNASMAATSQRFMSFAHGQGNVDRLSNIFNVSILLHAVIALALLVILEVAGLVLFHYVLRISPERVHAAWVVYQFAVACALLSIICVPYDAVINARENMLLFALVGLVEVFLKYGIALFIVDTSDDKLIMYGLLTTILCFFLFAIKVTYCRLRYQECVLAPQRFIDRQLIGEMKSFAGWSFLGSSTSLVANYGQGVVLNMFFGPAVNAAQAVAAQVGGQLGTLSGTMLRALNPFLVKSEGAGNRELMLKVSVLGSKVGFFLLMIFYVPVLLEMPYIFSVWLKDVPPYAITFCYLILVRTLIEQLFVTLPSSIAAVGNIRRYEIVTSSLTCVPLVASFLLFQSGYPAQTLYVVFIFYTVITSGVILYFASVVCGLRIADYIINTVCRSISAFMLSSLIGSGPIWALDQGSHRLLLTFCASMGSFLPVVWWIGFSSSERSDIKRLLYGFRRRPKHVDECDLDLNTRAD